MPKYNNALTNRPANRLAYQGSIGPVPRNEYLGALADFLAQSYAPERTQQMQGVSQFLGVPAVSQTLDRLSYGEPLTTGAGGLGGTTRIRPEVLEAAMVAAPLGKPATMATLEAARQARKAALASGKAGERYAEKIIPQIMEQGGLPADILQGMAQGSRRQIFVGENSKNWNKAAANKAVEMEKAGAKPEDIWTATGTFRGPEGKLRQEISDASAKFRANFDASSASKANEYVGGIEGPIGGMYEHPDLYAAYPELLRTDRMTLTKLPDWLPSSAESGMHSRTFGGKGKTEIRSKSEPAALSSTTHELQHAIQYLEGLPAGGTESMFGIGDDAFRQYQLLAGEAEARAAAARRTMTNEQRRAVFPLSNYDVPLNQLIYRK
jgi:hypothetical protein